MESLKPRPKSPTSIQYFAVSDGSILLSPILPPEIFATGIVQFIKRLPRDFLQLISSLDYLELHTKGALCSGYDFHVFNVEDFKKVTPYIFSSKQIKLFILDGSNGRHLELRKELINKQSEGLFFYFYNSTDERNRSTGSIESPSHFIKTLITQQEEILKYLGYNVEDKYPSVLIDANNIAQPCYFKPAQNNYLQLLSIMGNFGINETDLNPKQARQKHLEVSSKAIKATETFERQNLFVDQIDKIDLWFYALYNEKIIKNITPINQFLPPLILIQPFHNPDQKELYKIKKLTKLLSIEQTENYTFSVNKNGLDLEIISTVMKIIKSRLDFLDDISFLHASYWKVPQNSDTFSTYPHHIREFFLEQIAAVTFQERYVFSSCCNS